MFYFFHTTKEGDKIRLRPLANQTFEDGTPIDVTLNVQSPKEGNYTGNRNDYPIGTNFCSGHLHLVDDRATLFYSVYPNNTIDNAIPFHPVSENPDFKYVKPEHRNDEMNLAFIKFINNIQEDNNTETTNMNYKNLPTDDLGNALPINPDWKETYEGQIEDETGFFADWIRTVFADNGTPLAQRIVKEQITGTLKDLRSSGETLDHICSRDRFNKFLESEQIDYSEAILIKGGPHKGYLSWIYEEHKNGVFCTAKPLNPNDDKQLLDASKIVCGAHSASSGRSSASNAAESLKNLKKALEMGWTVSEMLNPDRLTKAASYPEYVKSLANSEIVIPDYLLGKESKIDNWLAEPKNKRPEANGGFHVDEKTWKILVGNLNANINTMLVGPSGSGKTEVIMKLCEQTGTPCTVIQMGAITEPCSQLVGKMDLKSVNGVMTTEFDWAPFALAIQKPGVIILDEINRIGRDGANFLFGCLNSTRSLDCSSAKMDDCRKIPVHPDCVFFATANIGMQYTGTKPIDEALRTRFMMLETDYLDIASETEVLIKRCGISTQEATNIAMIAKQIRNKAVLEDGFPTISTRETLLVAKLVSNGFDLKEALEYVILPLYNKGKGENDGTSQRAQVKIILASRFQSKS